jgi:hypothetical protein
MCKKHPTLSKHFVAFEVSLVAYIKKYCCVLHVDTQQKSNNFVANDNNVCNIGKKKLKKLSFTNDHGGTAVADFSSPHINPPYHMTIPELVDDKSGS